MYYDIQDISSPTTICTNYDSSIKSIEVDGTLLDSVVTTYQFNSVGEHVIKYEFNNPTTIGDSAPLFNNITTVKRAVISDTFTAIGSTAFLGCINLTNVIISNSVTNIGNSAFVNCSSLTSITIPTGVTTIGDMAFSSCTSLTSITIPDSVTSIGNNAFAQCSGLTSVTIGSGVISIGSEAFGGCSGLINITIGSGVGTIGQNAFRSCSGLTSIISLATTAPTIQSNTFYIIKTGGTLYVPQGSTGYDAWMDTSNYYLGKYNWAKVE